MKPKTLQFEEFHRDGRRCWIAITPPGAQPHEPKWHRFTISEHFNVTSQDGQAPHTAFCIQISGTMDWRNTWEEAVAWCQSWFDRDALSLFDVSEGGAA